MDCKVTKVKANSEDWLKLRRGRLTASHAADWCAKPESKRYKEYQKLIVLELLGYEDEEDDAPWFAHGKAMEPYARGAYQWKTGQKVDNDLMLIHKDYDWLSASPDGIYMPDYDGMIEIKCRAKLDRYLHILSEQERTGKIEAGYRYQVQCQLLVSGMDGLEFVNYYHDQEQMIRKMHVFPVERDKKMIDRIEENALTFITECYQIAEMKSPVRAKA